MMKFISLLLCSLWLGSCVTIVNNPQLTYQVDATGTQTQAPACERFIMPTLPDLPKIPELSDRVIKDRHLTEDALIQIISEHRNSIKKTRKVIDEAYSEYMKRCGSK